MEIIVDKNTVLPVDMTQEELDDLISWMKEMAESGKLEELSQPVDMDKLKEEEPDVYKTIMESKEVIEQ